MDSKKIGQKIASQRSKLNLTQTALAKKLCVSPKTISKWESGKGLPSLEFLPELSKILEITIDELLCKEIETIKKNSILEEMNAMVVFRMLSPNCVTFPEQVKEILKEEWLTFILEEDLTLLDYYNFVNSKCKPKSIFDCVDKMLNMENVSISGIQRKLKIGFARATKTRDKLVENSFVDKDSHTWIDKDYNKLCDLLTEELKGVSFGNEDTVTSYTSDTNNVTNFDFKTIKLINDNLSNDEKLEALELLEECSVDDNHPISSALCCFEREKVKTLLLTSNNFLNVEIYNLDSLENFKNEVNLPNATYALIIAESNKVTNILEVMTLCDLKIDSQISLKINNNLDKSYRLTIYYF